MKIRQADFTSTDDYLVSRRLIETTVGEYIASLLEPATGASPGYAGNVQLPAKVAGLFEVSEPTFVEPMRCEPPAFWLGPAGSITPLHKDSTDNVAFHVLGRKRWTLFPVQDTPRLALRRLPDAPHLDFAASDIDLRHPDVAHYPEFASAIPLEVTLTAGEALYLPAGWAHAVENQEISLMVNYWMSRESFARQYTGAAQGVS